MSQSKTEPRAPRAAGTLAAALATALLLAACSQPDLYLDHRETIGLTSGDAISANAATQTVDPWPPASGNPNIAFNGQKMQSAVERYRNNRAIPPISATTSDVIVPPGNAATPVVSVTQNSASGPPGAATTAPAQ
jgi:hypothetical protein